MDDSVSITTADAAFLPSSVDHAGNNFKHLIEEWGEFSPSVFRSATLKCKEMLLNRKRPFVGRCCHVCTPQSRDKLFSVNIPSLGLRNVIYINETHTRYRGWLARRLCYVLFVQERDAHKDMFPRNEVENVFNSRRVQKAILDVAAEKGSLTLANHPDHRSVSKVKRKARRILHQMVANVSTAMIRLTGWVLLKLFNGFFWSIQIHKGQLEMVKKATTEHSVPLIFLPVHKSHIDYLLLTFILFCHNIKAPHIAAGNNLNIPIFSTLIRKLGGFFIRRKLDETADGQKDVLYRSLLHGYVEELLRQQQFLEIFLEGTRSRSGKPSLAKAGLLSIIVESLWSNAISDVFIVPVGISYDRIIEGNYNSEQLGKPKKNESLWSVVRGVFRMLRKNYGCVRVDFAQPFSLKEYLENQRQRPLPAPLSLEYTLLPSILSERKEHNLYNAGDVVAANPRDLTDEPRKRQLIANLAKHTVFTANISCAVMSTHIVACLLLYRHRQGVNLSKLVGDFFSMKEEILARDFDLGFSGNSDDVVMHALHLLGNCVNVTSTRRNTEFFVTPSTSVPALFELNFYSNSMLHVFVQEAIIACSIHAVLKEKAAIVRGTSEVMVSHDRIARKAAELCYFLSNEITVALPCQMIYQVCHEAVGKFIQYGILLVAEEDQEDLSPSPTEQSWDKKYPDPVSWRSDEEDEDSDYGEEQRDRYLKVSQSQEHQEFLAFLQRLLGPPLEAYSSAAIFMHGLSGPVKESEYVQKLHKYLLTRTEKKVAVYGECATLGLVKTTVKTFKDLGVFKEKRETGGPVLELSGTFLPHTNRQKLLEYVLSFSLL
ncbi:glycerol-3-phosphate acyltransferase 1, mitochondrial [Latimeria chalumnae]|uniref:Glycerol-3-phosphate acyltransferase 1, mitochondrial n=1 Tax=Latimeria chalumnae TaxID=7897 RepID=M3XLN0_LATCH|nr:PREDICTED: glycerol-3-phosphate acyltransferase 1, mitochondrial [Latimeria chalumnae]XP_014343989.1 PREDICTED: glycerol-3-phosphate acyltransferase 1, mitochondrial [Latimeria chalumnae]XP_014343990.1 PREDICTED: glycerol-3-phosphate acyltransferase 1, mitochondrial [Latimeria chalumnae]|eukprot:XP_005996338.1 PREDICTED: glycerol-3-phosphate acyltransferase 1, mitochondrial [Latimeria chalumnae]